MAWMDNMIDIDLDLNKKSDLEQLVPHKGKMFLLDRVKNCDLDTITIQTQVDINESCMFYDENLGGVPVWISFEYMAQSISLMSGIFGRSHNEPPKVGFIMSVSSFNSHVPVFKKGDVITLKVHQTIRMDAAVTFEGQAYIGDCENGILAADGVLNTVEVPDPQKSLGL